MLSQLPLLALLASAAAVAADSTSTTSIFFGGLAPDDNSGDPDSNPFLQHLVASVVSVESNPTATVMAIGCKATDDSDACDVPPVTITANPSLFLLSTVIYSSDDNGMPISSVAVTISSRCELEGTTAGKCTSSQGGDLSAMGYASDEPGFASGAVTVPLSREDITFSPITITAGLEKLSQGASPASTGGSDGGPSATGGPSVTGTSSGSAGAPSQTGNAAMNVGVGKGLAVGALAAAGYLLV
jgi:hypothetical protein